MRGADTPLAEMIESFRVHNEARLSQYTMPEYLRVLRLYDTWSGNGSLGDLTLESVSRFVAEKKRTHATMARVYAATLKAFATWLSKAGYLVGPAGSSVLKPLSIPQVKRRRESYSDVEFQQILAAITSLSNKTRARDQAVILTLLATGLRLNELRQLRLADITITRPLEESFIQVREETSKSGEARKVRLDPMAAAAVHAYLEDWRPKTRAVQLFLTEEGKAFSYSGFSNYLGRIGDHMERAGIHDWMAHRCRHFWATSTVRLDGNPFRLRQEGGWKRGSKIPDNYVSEIPFEDIQRIPTALSIMASRKPLRRVS